MIRTTMVIKNEKYLNMIDDYITKMKMKKMPIIYNNCGGTDNSGYIIW